MTRHSLRTARGVMIQVQFTKACLCRGVWMQLLRTNMLSLSDLKGDLCTRESGGLAGDCDGANVTDAGKAVAMLRLQAAGLTEVEACLLILHLETAWGRYNKATAADGAWGGARDGSGGVALFEGRVSMVTDVLEMLLYRLSLPAMGRLCSTSKEMHALFNDVGIRAPFRRHAARFGISQSLVPVSWQRLLKTGVGFASSVVAAARELLAPVLALGHLKHTRNGIVFTLPVSRFAAHDAVIDRWRIGHEAPRTHVEPVPQMRAAVTVWCTAVPFCRSKENRYGDPLTAAFEQVLQGMQGWSPYEPTMIEQDIALVSRADSGEVVPVLASAVARPQGAVRASGVSSAFAASSAQYARYFARRSVAGLTC